MSSVAEFLYENKKREKEKNQKLREKKNNQNYSEYRKQEKTEYYKKHKKHKKHHRVKRSSLPTYNSLRNNSMLLKKHLQKENQRNLASLMLDPNKRLKSKRYKNLTAGGFEVHINKRYGLVDGRIGVCRFKGRTMFGKSSEDWIGIILDVGDGEHNGTVQGKSYFKCRDGRGIMVRPAKITDYLGSCTKMLSKQEIKAAEKAIKKYQKRSGKMETLPVENVDDGGFLEDHGDDMLREKTYHPMSVLNRNKGKKVKKKARYYEV